MNRPVFDFINELSPATYTFIENDKANKLIKNSNLLDSLIKKFTLQQVTVTARLELKLNNLDKIYSFGLFSNSNAYRLNVADDHFFKIVLTLEIILFLKSLAFPTVIILIR